MHWVQWKAPSPGPKGSGLQGPASGPYMQFCPHSDQGGPGQSRPASSSLAASVHEDPPYPLGVKWQAPGPTVSLGSWAGSKGGGWAPGGHPLIGHPLTIPKAQLKGQLGWSPALASAPPTLPGHRLTSPPELPGREEFLLVSSRTPTPRPLVFHR